MQESKHRIQTFGTVKCYDTVQREYDYKEQHILYLHYVCKYQQNTHACMQAHAVLQTDICGVCVCVCIRAFLGLGGGGGGRLDRIRSEAPQGQHFHFYVRHICSKIRVHLFNMLISMVFLHRVKLTGPSKTGSTCLQCFCEYSLSHTQHCSATAHSMHVSIIICKIHQHISMIIFQILFVI